MKIRQKKPQQNKKTTFNCWNRKAVVGWLDLKVPLLHLFFKKVISKSYHCHEHTLTGNTLNSLWMTLEQTQLQTHPFRAMLWQTHVNVSASPYRESFEHRPNYFEKRSKILIKLCFQTHRICKQMIKMICIRLASLLKFNLHFTAV